jgi:hypothetical protein
MRALAGIKADGVHIPAFMPDSSATSLTPSSSGLTGRSSIPETFGD